MLIVNLPCLEDAFGEIQTVRELLETKQKLAALVKNLRIPTATQQTSLVP